MPLTVHYFSPETPDQERWDIELPGTVRLGSVDGITCMAEMGVTGNSTIVLDDLTGDIGHDGDEILGLKYMNIFETAVVDTDAQRLGVFFIGKRTYARGTDSLITGVQRKITVEIVDENSLLSWHVIRAGDANRPAETVGDRMTWLLGTTWVAERIFDLGFVSYTGEDMDANDYTGQRVIDVVNDCAQTNGSNFFVYRDDVAHEFGLWFASNDTNQYDAGVNLTNDLATFLADPTTWRMTSTDAELTRDPARVAAGVYGAYANGAVYVESSTTGNKYGFRDQTFAINNIKTSGKATDRANLYLGDNAEEDDEVSVTVQLLAEDVTKIRKGQQLQTLFTHLPAYNHGTDGWVRVLECSYAQDEMTNDRYNVKLRMAPINHGVG